MAQQLSLCDVPFVWAARIEPDRDRAGAPLELIPPARYEKAATTPLNPYGAGPFCRFTIKGLPQTSGAYAVTVGGKVVYAGKAPDLAERWGPRGYAAIQPRNCFVGGQSTNCKVNHHILLAARNSEAIELWIHETDRPNEVEGRLIRRLNPPWNG
jgi:hypothetical protein